MARILVAILLVTGIAVAEDSPLVALAKRTNRKASKTPVITNDTIGRHSGRISFAGGQMPPISITAAAPANAGSSPSAPSPANTGAAAAASPETAGGTPPSTARNVAPSSSARTLEPTSGARALPPQGTGTAIQPVTSARSVSPQSTDKP